MTLCRRIYSLFYCLLLLPTANFFSQTYHFRNYSVDDGLPFIEVYTIFQDSKGNLWSGGYGGLSRFDGNTFSNFSPKNGLANHWVTSIAEDKDGNILAGTISGMSVFDGKKFTTVKNELPDEHVNCIVTDKKGRTWIGTERGLAVHENSRYKKVSGANTLALFCSSDGRVYAGTNDAVLAFPNDEATAVPLPGMHVNAICEDNEKKIWVGTDKGLFRLEEPKTIFTAANGLPDDKVRALVCGKQNEIWIATAKGLCKYKDGKITAYRIRPDINSNITGCLFLDYEDNLWIGSFSGLFRYRGGAFTTYSYTDGFSTTFIFPVRRDADHNLWVGTNNGGIYRMEGNRFVNYTEKDGLSGNNVNDLCLDSRKDFWIGTNKGLSKLVPGKKVSFRNYTMKDGIISDSVNCILEDKNGVLWLGGHNGLTRLQDGKISAIELKNDVPHFDVWYIFQDSRGRIWAGTYPGGVFVSNDEGKNFRYFNKESGFPSKSIFAIEEDYAGNIYFGTLDGVFRYDGKSFVQFSEKDGMSSDLVYLAICDKEKKNIWVGTNQGLNKIDLEAFNATGKKIIEPFGKEEGFSGVECNSNGAYREQDGSIWFGTVNGLIRYDPAEYRPNYAESKTSITGISIFYNDTLIPRNAELSWDQNSISIRYSGICLTNPDKVRYRHFLEGFESDWSPESKSNFSTYSNLPPGKYVFKVMSRNNEGKWNTKPAAFAFTILTPWWKTALFRIAIIFTFILLLLSAFRARLNRVRRREEARLKMATTELKALRAQMNPHFLFNSLNSIQNFIQGSEIDSASKYLNKFARLMRTILNHSEKISISLREEIDSLRLYLELETLRFENKFEYRIDVDEKVDLDYYQIPAMLLQPYVENAILHGIIPKGTKGALEIKIAMSETHIICTITDNGIGRKAAAEMKARSARKHESMGMKITRDRLEALSVIHGSRLSVLISDLQDENHHTLGTKVEVLIPIE